MSIAQYLFNPLFDTDSYKPSHPAQYPTGLKSLHSYMEARGGEGDFIIWVGLQAIIKEALMKPLTPYMVDEAAEFYAAHVNEGIFDREAWMYVVNKCNGYIPVTIRSLPEGVKVPTGVPTMTLTCDDANFAPCMQQLETLLLRVWYPSTVATISYRAKAIIKEAMEKSCDNLDGLAFKLHDFGSRGVSSPLSAALGGVGHLVNFQGSDTVLAVLGARLWYDCEMAGYSIAASEHSTMTAWGRLGEEDAFSNMIDKFGHLPMFACVSDAYDIERACKEIWGGKLKQRVLDMNATLIIRPDSGDPIYWLPRLLKILDECFGSTVNSKGYKVLNKVRLIQGDGVTIESLPIMINAILEAGYSLDNVAFGMGGGLLQKCDRDTYKWALKASCALIDDRIVPIFKDPITDPGKRSKKGMVSAAWQISEEGLVTLVAHDGFQRGVEDAMVEVYSMRAGYGHPHFITDSFDSIRYRAAQSLN